MSLHGNSSRPLTVIPHARAPHLHPHLETARTRHFRKKDADSQSNFSEVGNTVTQSVNHSADLSVILPCSDVMVVVMTRPTVLLSDWTSAAVQTSITSMAGKGKQNPLS